jgi:hypothetical protein
MSSSISTCPHCAQQVSISPGLEAEALVRCPICEAEFPLRLALVNAVEAPPELVPVARVEALRDTAVRLATPPETAPAKTKDVEAREAALSPTSPSATAGIAPGPAGANEKADPAPASRPVDTAALVRALDEEQGPSPEIYGLAGQSPGAGASALPDVTHAQAAALWRSRQKASSSFGAVGKGIAIVVGGFLGIAIVYFIFSIISPRKFDFLHLWGRPRPGNAGAPASDSGNNAPGAQTPGKFDPDNPTFPDLDEKRSSGPKRRP